MTFIIYIQSLQLIS